MISKSIAAVLLASATMLGASAAHAGGHVSWSIGINAPVVGAVIGNAPYYGAAPVYVPGPSVYVAPVPVYEALPAPVYYPEVRYYRPQPVVYPYRWHRDWREDRRHDGDRRHGDRYDGDRHDGGRH